jgi:hypothetical protein
LGDREDLDALHELVNFSSIHLADLRSAGYNAAVKRALRELGSRGAPSGGFPINTGDFDIDTARHRFLI